jgi:putative membrane protein
MQRRLILILILILIIVVFALQNAEPITIQLFFWQVNSPPAVIIAVTILIGAILGVMFSGSSKKGSLKKSDTDENLEDNTKSEV